MVAAADGGRTLVAGGRVEGGVITWRLRTLPVDGLRGALEQRPVEE